MNLIKQLLPNQLVQNGNFADTSNWIVREGATFEVNNNIGKFTIGNLVSYYYFGLCLINIEVGHKYLTKFKCKTVYSNNILVSNALAFSKNIVANEWNDVAAIYTAAISYKNIGLRLSTNNQVEGEIVEFQKFQVFDLTELYGAGNEPSTVQAFKADFPLDYYPYRATSGNELLTTNLGGALTCDLSQMLPSGVGCVDWQNITINYVANKQIFEVRTTDRLDNSTDLVSNLYVNSANALAEMPDMTMRGNAGAPYIYIKNTSYTDAQSFKQAMQGVPLLYKKA